MLNARNLRIDHRPFPARPSGPRVAVAVLGDLGRSPRMLYHARLLADSGARVTLIGRAGALPQQFLGGDISVRTLPARRRRGSTAAETARWIVETARLFVELLRASPEVVLLQAPPLVPAALAALAASRIRGARLIIDWHNFGDALLALRPRGAGAPAALLAAVEGVLGRAADGHLAVSEELAAALPDARGVFGARVFRDRPHERFSAAGGGEAAAFRAEIVRSLALPFAEPLLLALCPTSWGRDEELDRLIPAAERAAAELSADARPILLLASGDGDGREAFEARSRSLPASRIAVRTTFVPGDAYPLLVRSADVGVSLHRPALGLDPPMKVADLLGAGVPVLELRGGAAPASLVVDGRNGEVFGDTAGLAAALVRLASDPRALAGLRAGAQESGRPSFREAWLAEAAPLLLRKTA